MTPPNKRPWKTLREMSDAELDDQIWAATGMSPTPPSPSVNDCLAEQARRDNAKLANRGFWTAVAAAAAVFSAAAGVTLWLGQTSAHHSEPPTQIFMETTAPAIEPPVPAPSIPTVPPHGYVPAPAPSPTTTKPAP